jgi:hypothetical protein
MKLSKRVKSLIIVSVLVILVLLAGMIMKEIFLRQLKSRIQSRFAFSQLQLSLFPPALVIEDANSLSEFPFISAQKITLSISYRSLFSKEKPLTVTVENPRINVSSTILSGESEGQDQIKLPFAIEKGIIRGGDVRYEEDGVVIHAKGVNAFYTQNKDEFSIQAEARENLIILKKLAREISGKLTLLVAGKGRELQINRFRFDGPDTRLNASGTLIDPLEPELQLKGSLRIPIDLITGLFDLPFKWEGDAEGEASLNFNKEGMSYQTEFSGRDFVLNDIYMGDVKGTLDFRSESGGNVELSVDKDNDRTEYVRIRFNENIIEGTARDFSLDPIMKYIGIPWPISSPAWGDFQIKEGRLTADAEFRDEILQAADSSFPVRGQVHVDWDGGDHVIFNSENIDSPFASVDVNGSVIVDKEIDISLKGEVKDVIQARKFTSQILETEFTFPEIRGSGQAEIYITDNIADPRVRMEFDLAPGGFDTFDVRSVSGSADIYQGDFHGEFRFEDTWVQGTADIFASENGAEGDIKLDRGAVETILPGFGVEIALSGEASGNFKFQQIEEEISVQGDFESQQAKFVDQPLDQVKGKMEWKEDYLSFPELQFGFHSGLVSGSVLFQTESRKFDVDVNAQRINLNSVYPDIEGYLSLSCKGKGGFDQDLASGSFKAADLYFSPFQPTAAEGELKVGFSDEWIRMEADGNFLPGENNVYLSLDIPLGEDSLSGEVRGSFTNFDLLLPWSGAKGRIGYLAELKDLNRSPQLTGAIDFQGSILPFPRFAHAVRDYSGLIFVENGNLSVRSFKGTLGGGEIQGSGRLKIGNDMVEEIDIQAEGTNLLLSPLERTQGLADGNFRLLKDENLFLLEGILDFSQLSWRREIDERFVFYSEPYYETQREPQFFDDLTLDIRLRADDNAWMDNSLGRLRARFDLTIAGHISLPIILGDIETLEGDVFFQDRKFKILRGRVSFINPSAVEPYLDFSGETYVKDYRVTFSLSGLLDRLNPEFSSSPPLPPEDVLALLALGESFKRTYQYDRSTRLSTTSLLSFQLSEEAKKRTSGLFSLDRFRIDPFIMGSSAEMTARLTLGKRVTRNLFVMYSTNLTSQREEITRIEWELMRDLSVVSTRDEIGRVSLVVKIHKRF